MLEQAAACGAAWRGWDLTWEHMPTLLRWIYVGDLGVFVWYFLIPAALAFLVWRLGVLPSSRSLVFSACFVFACGCTHLVKSAVIFHPWYLQEVEVLAACNVFSALALLSYFGDWRDWRTPTAADRRASARRQLAEMRRRLDVLEGG